MATPPKTLRSGAADTCILGPLRCPGIVRDIDIPREHKVDKSAGGATSGATLKTNGEKPVPVKITFEWWDDPESPVENATNEELELARYAALDALCFPGGTKSPDPLDIVHPIAALRGVKSILVQKLGSPKEIAPGRWQAVLEGTKFVPPPAKPVGVSSTPTSAKEANLAQQKSVAQQQLAEEQSQQLTAANYAAARAAWKQKYDAWKAGRDKGGDGQHPPYPGPPPGGYGGDPSVGPMPGPVPGPVT